MKVPDKFPPGTKFHDDRSSATWVEFPDGKVFRFNDETNELMERDALPVGSLIHSWTEAQFLAFAKDVAE
jgi:hypothetical protein